MTGPDPADRRLPALRISDADRNAAMTALGEHLAAGRLDLSEYSTRSGTVAAARTAADLAGVFDDLPAPHPVIAGLTTPQPAVPAPSTPSRLQAVMTGVAGAAGLLAVIAFFLLRGVWDQAWLVFLLVPVVGAIAGSVANADRQRRRQLGPGDRPSGLPR